MKTKSSPLEYLFLISRMLLNCSVNLKVKGAPEAALTLISRAAKIKLLLVVEWLRALVVNHSDLTSLSNNCNVSLKPNKDNQP